MKNKRYRELAAILVMMTMTAGSITTVAAETETTAETETDESECRFRGSRNSRYPVPGDSLGSN